jgi:hypothetical protein
MSSQLSLSFELICLMDWLVKNGQKDVTNLVKGAIKKGFEKELDKISDADYSKMDDYLNNTVLEFVFMLEDILIKEIEGVSVKESIRENTSATMKNMDIDAIDTKTVWLSLQQTKSQLKKRKEDNKAADEAKKILCAHLIKNWKPKAGDPVN